MNLTRTEKTLKKKIKEIAKQYCVAPTTEGVKGLAALFGLMNRLPQQMEQAGTDIIHLSAFLSTIASLVASKLSILELECFPIQQFSHHIVALSTNIRAIKPSVLDIPVSDDSEIIEAQEKHRIKVEKELDEVEETMTKEIEEASEPIDEEEDEKTREKELQKQQKAIEKIKQKAEREKTKIMKASEKDWENKKKKLEKQMRDKEKERQETSLLPEKYIQIANNFLTEGVDPEGHSFESILEIITEVAKNLPKNRLARIARQLESDCNKVIENVKKNSRNKILQST